MSEEVKNFVAVDSGRGADGPPGQTQAPVEAAVAAEHHDLNYCVSRAITLGLKWASIVNAFVRHGEAVLDMAEKLRRAGFSPAWVEELIEKDGQNGMLAAMLNQQNKK